MPARSTTPSADDAQAGLEVRIREFANTHDWAIERIDRLAGDVSTRLYFRVADRHRTAIVAVYPPADWKAAERFVRSGELFASIGVRVPAVLGLDADERLMMLEDLGSTCYQLAVDQAIDLERVFAVGAEMVPMISALDLDAEPLLLPPLDSAVLSKEMATAADALEALATDSHRARLRTLLDGVGTTIEEHLTGMPLAAAHRDFMIRNLVPLPNGTLAVLDHQDLRPAPAGYDFASLTNDSVFPSFELVDELRRRWLPALETDDYHWLAAQRTLKASGTYAGALTRGNDIHRQLIGPTVERLVDHLRALPDITHLADDLLDGAQGLAVLD